MAALALLSLASGCGRVALDRGEQPDGALARDGAPDGADAKAPDAGDARADTAEPAAPACTPGNRSDLAIGTIDHRPFQLGPASSSFTGFPVIQPSWSILEVESTDKAMLIWGEGDRGGGTQRNAGGVIVVPDQPPNGTTHYCASRVETELIADLPDPVVAIHVSELSILGRCPGTPVPGSVQFCTGKSPSGDAGPGACADSFDVSGTIEGAAVRFRDPGGSLSRGEQPSGVVSLSAVVDGGDEGVLLFDTGADGSMTGWLRLANGDGTNAGHVYCLADGHATKEATNVFAVRFGSIGRLGGCPGTPVDGRVDLCR